MTNCESGKSLDEPMGELVVDPFSGETATLWVSYNGEGCGENDGEVPAETTVQWTQLVENASGELMVNLLPSDDLPSGWLSCSDILFTSDMEVVMGKLEDDQFDLYLECVNISKQN